MLQGLMDGKELASGVWEHAVYLGADEFVYEVEARRDGDEIVLKLDRKKTIADYFRSIVGRIEAAGGFPGASDYHHRATVRLAELSWGKEPTGSCLDARLSQAGTMANLNQTHEAVARIILGRYDPLVRVGCGDD